MADALEAMAYAEEALDGGAIILIPQEDGQPVLLGEALVGGGSQLVLGQLQPLQLEGSDQVAAAPLVFAPVSSEGLMATAAPAAMVTTTAPTPQQEEASPLRQAEQPQAGGDAAPLLRTVTQTMKVRWLDELLAHKGIHCPISDCPFTCLAITAMEKHYAQCAGVNGSGLDQCPYCEAQFLTHSSALHVHIVEEHPTRRSLMQSHVGEGRYRRSLGGASRRSKTPTPPPPPPLKRPLLGQAPTTAGQQQAGGTQWDWEQRRRTYSRSWGEPMGPTSELFRRAGSEEEDPLQLPRSVINRSEITMSSEELALDDHQLQQEGAATAESVEGGEPPVETPTPDTIRLEPMPPARISRGRGGSSRRPPRSRYRGDHVRTMQVIVKNASGAESTSALLRNPRVLQTLGDLAVNAATTGASATVTLATGGPSPQVDEDEADQAVVAVHSATASDGRYLQVERALKAPTLRPAEVDRFFGRRVDCSCQTDDLPPVPPVRPELPPAGTIAPPAILKRTRLLAPAQAKVPGRPLAVSIVCSSRASSSDEEDDGNAPVVPAKQQSQQQLVSPRAPATQASAATGPQPSPLEHSATVHSFAEQTAAPEQQLLQQFVLATVQEGQAAAPVQPAGAAVELPPIPQLMVQQPGLPQQFLVPVSQAVLLGQPLQQHQVAQLLALQKSLAASQPALEESLLPQPVHLTALQQQPVIVPAASSTQPVQPVILLPAGQLPAEHSISQKVDEQLPHEVQTATVQAATLVDGARAAVEASSAHAEDQEHSSKEQQDAPVEPNADEQSAEKAASNAAEEEVAAVTCEAPPMPAEDSSACLDGVTVECDPEDKALADSLPAVIKSQEGLQQQTVHESTSVCLSVEGLPVPGEPTVPAQHLQEQHSVPGEADPVNPRAEQEPQRRYCEELCDLQSCSIPQQEFGQSLEPERHLSVEGQPVSQCEGSYAFHLHGPDSSPEQVVPQHDVAQHEAGATSECALEGTSEESLTACEDELLLQQQQQQGAVGQESQVVHAPQQQDALERSTDQVEPEESSASLDQQDASCEGLAALPPSAPCSGATMAQRPLESSLGPATGMEGSVQQSAQDGNTFIVSSQPHPMHVLVPSLDTASTDDQPIEEQGALRSEEVLAKLSSQASQETGVKQACLLLSMPEGVPGHETRGVSEQHSLAKFSGQSDSEKPPAEDNPVSPEAKRFKACKGDAVEPVYLTLPCSRDDSDAFMDDADSASSCEALHIVESVPEEEARSVGRAGTGESQADAEDVAGHFLVVSGGRRVAASTCAQIPVQLVVSDGMQQLKRLACNVTCRTLEQSHKSFRPGKPTLQFTVELKLGSRSSTLRPLVKPWSKIVGRPAVKRQRPKRFQLRFKPTSLPQQLRPPVIGSQREDVLPVMSEQTVVLEEEASAGSSSSSAGPHLEATGEPGGRRLKGKPTKRSQSPPLEGRPSSPEPKRRRGRPRKNDNSPEEGAAGDGSPDARRRSSGRLAEAAGKDSFTCSGCGKLFTCRKEASHHILHAHYNLARLNDERPLSEQEVRAALRRAAESLDQLVCRGCGVAFETYMSFYLHRSRCQTEEQQTGGTVQDKRGRKRAAAARQSFTCSACKCAFGSRQEADTHILRTHYNLARVNDDRPLTALEVVSALNQIKNRLRRFDCHQPGCNHHAASASEYLHHLNICGPYAGQIAAAGQAVSTPPLRKKKSQAVSTRPGQPKRVPCFKINLDFPDGTALVCSSCRKSFTCKEAVTEHVLKAHYNLARVNDERPLSLEEMRSALRQASLTTSRFACSEPGCEASFASYMSYYSHLRHCGPFVETFIGKPVEVPCPPASPTAQDPSEKGKRSSALRALASFRVLEGAADNAATVRQVSADSDFAPSEGEGEHECDSWGDDDDDDEELQHQAVCEEDRPPVGVILQRAWQGRYEAPQQQPVAHIDPKMVASWADTLAHTPHIQCPNEGCPKQFSTVPGLRYHFRRCRLMQLYRCLNCSEGTFAHPKSLLQHLRSCYPERPEGDQPRTSNSHRRSVVSSQRLPAQLSSTLGPLFHHLYQHMQQMERQSQCWEETLYPGWTSSGWRLLDQQETRLPRFRESPALRSRCAGKPGTQEWQRLPLFGCLSPAESCHVTFYPGGAIWAAAWCPLPPPGEEEEQPSHHQWVALSCCPDPDREHPLTEATSEPGLLQIWDLGPLQLNRGPRERSVSPRLGLCLAHDFGFVAGLDWCPSGCYQEGDRLGLLALACGDGCARILSIPFPDSLPTAEDQAAPVYTVGGSELLQLCVPPGPLGVVPCTRVAWDVARRHQHIALGFADGRVAVFRAARSREEEPLWVWQAHQGAIMGLGWTPQGHVCTAAIDQAAKVWDLHRPGLVPVSAIVRGPARQMALSPHWNGLFVVGEESAVCGPAHSLFLEGGYYGFTPKTLVSHYATVWGVTVSPWSNVVASCDASGKVAAILLPYMSSNQDFVKHHPKVRLPLFRAQLVPQVGNEKHRGCPTQHCGHALAQQQYGISFEDVPLDRESSFLQQERVEKKDSSGQYQLNSFTTVCWSPNRSSANWLFSAGQAGVARLTWLGLYAKRLKDASS